MQQNLTTEIQEIKSLIKSDSKFPDYIWSLTLCSLHSHSMGQMLNPRFTDFTKYPSKMQDEPQNMITEPRGTPPGISMLPIQSETNLMLFALLTGCHNYHLNVH